MAEECGLQLISPQPSLPGWLVGGSATLMTSWGTSHLSAKGFRRLCQPSPVPVRSPPPNPSLTQPRRAQRMTGVCTRALSSIHESLVTVITARI